MNRRIFEVKEYASLAVVPEKNPDEKGRGLLSEAPLVSAILACSDGFTGSSLFLQPFLPSQAQGRPEVFLKFPCYRCPRLLQPGISIESERQRLQERKNSVEGAPETWTMDARHPGLSRRGHGRK